MANKMLQIKSKMLLPAILGLLVVLSGTSLSYSAEVRPDVIYVNESDQDGVYSELQGRILDSEITNNEMIIIAKDKRLLYERNAVRRVILNSSHTDKTKELVSKYWNEKEFLIAPLFINPIAFIIPGTDAKELGDAWDKLPGPLKKLSGVLILLVLLFYGAYRLYEIFFVRTHLRNLNMDKLNMEVRKLRYELRAFEEKAGEAMQLEPEAPVIEAAGKIRFPYSFDVSQLRILDFIKHKIFRLYTEKEKESLRESWSKKWETYKDSSNFVIWLGYSSRIALNAVGLFFTAMFSLGSFVDVIFVLIEYEEFGTELGESAPLLSGMFFVLFIISFGISLRLHSKGKIIKAAYDEALSTRAKEGAST